MSKKQKHWAIAAEEAAEERNEKLAAAAAELRQAVAPLRGRYEQHGGHVGNAFVKKILLAVDEMLRAEDGQ